MLPKLSDVFANNPIHKAVQDLQGAVHNARTDLNLLACSLKTDNTSCRISSPPVAEAKNPQSGLKTAPASEISPPVSTQSYEVPTEEETVIELKKRLGKEIAKAENDLTNKLKIPKSDGTLVACSCLSNKHNVVIEGLSEELIPKEPNNALYREIMDWFKVHEPNMTVQASASGKYDEEYIKYAGKLGEFRRRLSQTPSPLQPVKSFLKDKGV